MQCDVAKGHDHLCGPRRLAVQSTRECSIKMGSVWVLDSTNKGCLIQCVCQGAQAGNKVIMTNALMLR